MTRVENGQVLITNIQRYCIHDGPGVRTNVFFKGCPLSCPWCSNPECIKPNQQIGYVQTTCRGCGYCVKECPVGALSFREGELGVQIDRNLCTECGKCAETCYRGAMKVYGKPMTVDEVFEQVSRDHQFYDKSGGGITVSGGEPLLHVEFVTELFQRAHSVGIRTAFESCLCVAPKSVKTVLAYTDECMFDLKIFDAKRHKEVCGVSNENILINARQIAESGIPAQPRMPLIPGVNDTDENIIGISKFLTSINLPKIELMPYHKYGSAKYRSLDMDYPMGDLASPDKETIRRVQELYIANGVDCTVSI